MNLLCCASGCCESFYGNEDEKEDDECATQQQTTNQQDEQPNESIQSAATAPKEYHKVPLEKLFDTSKKPQMSLMHSQPRKDSILTGTIQTITSRVAKRLEFQDSSFSLSQLGEALSRDIDADEPRIDFIIFYDLQTFLLTVTLLEGHRLPAKGKKSTSNPYVTLCLKPPIEEVFRSKTCYKNLNPIFNQTFVFPSLSFQEVDEKFLVLRVYTEEKFSGDILIGMATLPLHKLELHGVRVSTVMDEVDEDDEASGKGEIQLSFWYNSSENVLSGLLIKAINLQRMDIVGLSDPYVKIKLWHKEEVITKWQSKVLKKTITPVFNQNFTFDLADVNLKDIVLRLVVKDRDIFGKDDIMGSVDFGISVEHESGRNHWKEIIDNPYNRIVHWHSLA